MIEARINTVNVKILEDFFSGLSAIDQRKIFTSSFRKAAKPLVSRLKTSVPKRSGNLMRSIGSLMVSREIAIIVGARKTRPYKGYHGHLVEDGTAPRFRKSGGSTGAMPATHFFENTYNSTFPQMQKTMEDEWYHAIDRFIISTNKKFKK